MKRLIIVLILLPFLSGCLAYINVDAEYGIKTHKDYRHIQVTIFKWGSWVVEDMYIRKIASTGDYEFRLGKTTAYQVQPGLVDAVVEIYKSGGTDALEKLGLMPL